MIILHAVLFLMLLAGFGYAGQTDYYCTIKQDLELSNSGKIQEVKNSPFIEKDFRIDRQTGNITAASKLSGIEKMRVLFRGSAKHSFIAVTEIIGPYPKASLLEIQEFKSGVSKPFLWHAPGAVLYSGTCV
jgi:hypothetical protein